MLGLVPGTRTLAIGTPLLDVLDVSELRAVLAHELGHPRRRRHPARAGGRPHRPGPRRHHPVARQRGDRPGVLRLLALPAPGQRRRPAGPGGRRRPGRWVAGRQAAADALRDVEVAAQADDVFKYEYLGPLFQRGRRPDDLVGGWRRLVADGDRTRELARAADADRADRPLGLPPPDPRADPPDRRPGPGGRRRSRPGRSSLFRDPDAWIRAANDRWLRLAGIPEDREAVPWSAWGEVVASAEQVERAGDTDRALDRLGCRPDSPACTPPSPVGGSATSPPPSSRAAGGRPAPTNGARSLRPPSWPPRRRRRWPAGRGGPRRGRARGAAHARRTADRAAAARRRRHRGRLDRRASSRRPRRSPPARSVRPSTWPRRLPRLPRLAAPRRRRPRAAATAAGAGPPTACPSRPSRRSPARCRRPIAGWSRCPAGSAPGRWSASATRASAWVTAPCCTTRSPT